MNAAATPDQLGPSGGERARALRSAALGQLSTLGPLIALFIAAAFFTFESPRFLTGTNLSLIVQQVMVVGTLAIGQTLVILTAGIDLSDGAVMALGAVVMAKLAVVSGLNPFLAILLGLAVWRRGARSADAEVTPPSIIEEAVAPRGVRR